MKPTSNPRFAPVLSSSFAILIALCAACPEAEAGDSGARPGESRLWKDSPSKRGAESGKFSISAYFGGAFPGAQSAGLDAEAPPPQTQDRSAPDFDDAFGPGFCFGAAVSCRFMPAAQIGALFEFSGLNGKTRSEGYLGRIRYSDLRAFFIGTSFTLSAPLGLPVSDWFHGGNTARNEGFEPYFRIEAGLSYLDRVELETVGGYWKASTVFFASVKIGLEFGIGAVGLFFEAGVRYVSEPGEAVWFAEADSLVAFPLAAGIRLYF